MSDYKRLAMVCKNFSLHKMRMILRLHTLGFDSCWESLYLQNG